MELLNPFVNMSAVRDTDKWMTPPEVYDPLNAEFQFNYDPCPIEWKQGDVDGLRSEWGTRCFVNPPYSCANKWIEKAAEESSKGKLVVMLINAITDTKAFHEHIYNKPNIEVRFVAGRISFTGLGNCNKLSQQYGNNCSPANKNLMRR